MRILIADDHTLFRDSLVTLLEASGHEVVGAVGDGRAAVELTTLHRPDVVLLDLAMPEVGGLEATRLLAAECPDQCVVILTASDDERSAFAALEAGASGYLVKNLSADSFIELLERAGRGEPVLSPALARQVLHRLRYGHHDPDALTQRETEVLQAMTAGITSNRKLSRELGVSENTVKFHVRNILDKLHLNSRAQAVGFALRNHLVEDYGGTR